MFINNAELTCKDIYRVNKDRQAEKETGSYVMSEFSIYRIAGNIISYTPKG